MIFQNLNQHLRKFFYYNKCSVCNKTLDDSELYICKECQKYFKEQSSLKNFRDVYYIFDYDKNFKSLIKNYKFYNRKYLGFFISKLIDKNLKKVIIEKNIDIIIPVPLNKKRLISRGFNQVSFILDILNIEYSNIIRIKNTKHMSFLLDKNMRKYNISKAFYIPIDINKKNILIIDDIITTGSTINEIIKELKISGTPKSITIFTFSMAHSYKKIFLGENK